MKNVRDFTYGRKIYIKQSNFCIKIFLYLSILYNIYCENSFVVTNFNFQEECTIF